MNRHADAGTKKLLLVADDDLLIRESLTLFLQKQGYEVIAAHNGQEVLHWRSLVIPDLIVLDVCMPEPDGIATCRTLREQWISPRIPILMLTGQYDSRTVDLAFEAGADDYLIKPVHWALLRQKVHQLLERSAVEARIRHQATYDGLTDLPNRILFLDRLDHAISLARRTREALALLFIDLDRFKEVNDTLGHACGDELLRQVGQRLKNCVRHSDSLARLGGDEFTVIVANVCQPPDPDIVAEKILTALAQPFMLNGTQVTISASIGITLFPDHGADLTTLLENADQAMYEAKKLGGNRYHNFVPATPPQGTPPS
ncbi:MAG: diguanylate cyclase [Magnetococcales bacterium]|nr:diguanylate cyclase [Magnetococcales bacterium]